MQTAELRLETTESTMKAAKALMADQDFILVTSLEQTQGIGTRGRSWQGGRGNIFMTVGINRRFLSEGRLGLMPLEIGLHIWKAVASKINPELRSQLTLKWPNDLMFRGMKTAGILMEAQGKFLLIGIGINIVTAPTITDGGNPSTCLSEAGLNPLENDHLIDGIYQGIIRVTEEKSTVQADSQNELDSLHEPDSLQNQEIDSVLVEWQAKVDWNRLHRLRDRPGQPLVRPITVNGRGHLQVEHNDGSREWLVSDYLI